MTKEMKMNLSYEYNEYVVGYVVTDLDTGRSVNFQFDHDRNINYNPENQRHFLTWGCEGDDTYKVFSEDELKEAAIYLKSEPDAQEAEKIITTIFENPESIEEMYELRAEQGCLHYSVLQDLAEKSTWVWAVIYNGNIDEDLAYKTKEEAIAEAEEWDEEDAYLVKVIHIDPKELSAIGWIKDLAEDREQAKIIIELFYSDACSESKDYVIEQLNELCLTSINEEIVKKYFYRLMASEYGYRSVSCLDGETYHEIPRLSFKDYFIQEINELINLTFDKQVDISSLINN